MTSYRATPGGRYGAARGFLVIPSPLPLLSGGPSIRAARPLSGDTFRTIQPRERRPDAQEHALLPPVRGLFPHPPAEQPQAREEPHQDHVVPWCERVTPHRENRC